MQQCLGCLVSFIQNISKVCLYPDTGNVWYMTGTILTIMVTRYWLGTQQIRSPFHPWYWLQVFCLYTLFLWFLSRLVIFFTKKNLSNLRTYLENFCKSNNNINLSLSLVICVTDNQDNLGKGCGTIVSRCSNCVVAVSSK